MSARATIVQALAWAKDLRGSKPVNDLTVRHLALDGVERLMFVKDHRIRIAHRRRHQAQ